MRLRREVVSIWIRLKDDTAGLLLIAAVVETLALRKKRRKRRTRTRTRG